MNGVMVNSHDHDHGGVMVFAWCGTWESTASYDTKHDPFLLQVNLVLAVANCKWQGQFNVFVWACLVSCTWFAVLLS